MKKHVDLNEALAAFVDQRIEEQLAKVFKQFAGRQETQQAPKVRKSRKPSDETMKKRVLEFIKKNPGLRSEELQSELGNKEDVKVALAQLRADQLVKMSGIKRAATYQA